MRLLLTFIMCAAAAAAAAVAVFLASPHLVPYAERAWAKIPFDLGVSRPRQDEKGEILPPLPEKFFPTARMDMTPLDQGLKMKTSLAVEEGDTAAKLRTEDSSYQVNVELNVRVPKPAVLLEQFQAANSNLVKALPALPALLQEAQVSSFYHSLYQRKVKFLGERLRRFRDLISRHNFFDCDTMLELTHPETGRKALLIQAEMDVVTDGSDPDRFLKYDASSPYFQPFTAYSWAKTGTVPNPFLDPREEESRLLTVKLGEKSLSGTERASVKQRLTRVKEEIAALKYRASLVAAIDPFIVVPGFMVEYAGNPFAPSIGDFAVVIHKDRIYPAVVGDSGPYSKVGEASLLLCQQIDPSSDSKRRPISDLNATYIVFPGTAPTKFGPPDLIAWREQCLKLLNELGGVGVPVHDWTDPAQRRLDMSLNLGPQGDEQADASPDQPLGRIYVVEWGDSLWKIAEENGIGVERLKEFNNLQSDVLRPGQTLRIPED